MFMIGNLFRESGAVPRLTSAASNEILNIATIFLMLTIGAQLSAERVFQLDTLIILGLGLVAFACGTIGGLLFAKIMNLFLKEKINPADRLGRRLRGADGGAHLSSHRSAV